VISSLAHVSCQRFPAEALQRCRVELPFAHEFDGDTAARRLVVHALLTNSLMHWLGLKDVVGGLTRTFKSVYTGDSLIILVCWYLTCRHSNDRAYHGYVNGSSRLLYSCHASPIKDKYSNRSTCHEIACLKQHANRLDTIVVHTRQAGIIRR
jgi:hypothetical protein